MGIGKRLEKLEKRLGPQGECKCEPRTRVLLPDDEPGQRYDGPDEGICEKCGGRWENVLIEIVWVDALQDTVRRDWKGGTYTERN